MRVAFATSEQWSGLAPSDALVVRALAHRGVAAEPLVWSEQDSVARASAFDLVVIRSCWDYHLRHSDFVQWLRQLDTVVCNDVELMVWNSNKRYLADLESRGIPVVPSRFVDTARSSDELFEVLAAPRLVVKPLISASAHQTRVVEPGDEGAWRDVIVQPFIEEIVHGEWSLIMLDGELAHSVLKRPAPGDFRVQKDFGGTATVATPPASVRELAVATTALLHPRPLYARIDVIESEALGVRMMEAELIEPELFFDLAPESTERFADAIMQRLREATASA